MIKYVKKPSTTFLEALTRLLRRGWWQWPGFCKPGDAKMDRNQEQQEEEEGSPSWFHISLFFGQKVAKLGRLYIINIDSKEVLVFMEFILISARCEMITLYNLQKFATILIFHEPSHLLYLSFLGLWERIEDDPGDLPLVGTKFPDDENLFPPYSHLTWWGTAGLLEGVRPGAVHASTPHPGPPLPRSNGTHSRGQRYRRQVHGNFMVPVACDLVHFTGRMEG